MSANAMSFKIGDRAYYVHDETETSIIFDYGSAGDMLAKYPDFNIHPISFETQIVIYSPTEGWDYMESMVSAEVYHSPLYQALLEKSDNEA